MKNDRKSSAYSKSTRSVVGEIEGLVEIADSLYAKSPEALEKLLAKLQAYGYEVKDCSKDNDRPNREVQEKNGWYLWYASLGERVMQRMGKCGSCGAYISTNGIQSHKHKCEVCGAFTYIKYQDGTIIRFKFLRGREQPMSPTLKMKVFDYDDETGLLLLYRQPEEGNGFNDYRADDARKVIESNSDWWVGIKRDYLELIGIQYNPYTIYVEENAVIEMYDVWGSAHNHQIVKLFKGKEYGEWDHLPVAEGYSIYEAWRWMPLSPDPKLHERIIGAARMVSRVDYYYQDERTAFYDVHLGDMWRFVEHFTTLDLDQWDKMITHASRSGPGMIKAVASFCHAVPEIEDNPNFGNTLVALEKAMRGNHLTDEEVRQAKRGLEDPLGKGFFHRE